MTPKPLIRLEKVTKRYGHGRAAMLALGAGQSHVKISSWLGLRRRAEFAWNESHQRHGPDTRRRPHRRGGS